MTDTAAAYSAHMTYRSDYYINYDMLKRRIHEISSGKQSTVEELQSMFPMLIVTVKSLADSAAMVRKLSKASSNCDNANIDDLIIERNRTLSVSMAQMDEKLQLELHTISGQNDDLNYDNTPITGMCSMNDSLDSPSPRVSSMADFSDRTDVAYCKIDVEAGNTPEVVETSGEKLNEVINPLAPPVRSSPEKFVVPSNDDSQEVINPLAPIISNDSLSKSEPLKEFKNDNFKELFLLECSRISCFLEEKLFEILELVISNEDAAKKFKFNMKNYYKKIPVNDKDPAYKKLKEERKREMKINENSIKRSLLMSYHELNEIESYRLLNLTFILKILAKYDKKIGTKCGCKAYPGMITQTIANNLLKTYKDDIEVMKQRVEKSYAIALCADDTLVAKCKLLNSKLEADLHSMQTLGYYGGAITIMFVWFIWDTIDQFGSIHHSLWNDPALFIYTCIGNLILYKWLWGICVYVWTISRINYLYLLDINQSKTLRYDQIWLEAAQYTLVFVCNLLAYCKSARKGLHGLNIIPSYYFPLGLCIWYGFVFLYQYRFTLQHNVQGVFTFTVIRKIVTAPFAEVKFKLVYAADILTSFVRVIAAGANGACYLISSSYNQANSSLSNFGFCQSDSMIALSGFIAILPLYFRFAQCMHMLYEVAKPDEYIVWPHSYNSFKYFLGLVTVVISLSFPLQDAETGLTFYQCFLGIVLVASTLYNTWWDIYCDWGLFQILHLDKTAGQLAHPSIVANATNFVHSIPHHHHFLLRSKLMYGNAYIYYAAMVIDLILRAVWCLSLVPQNSTSITSFNAHLFPFLAAIEQCRRCMWGILRMEWEHIKFSDAKYSKHLKADEEALHAANPDTYSNARESLAIGSEGVVQQYKYDFVGFNFECTQKAWTEPLSPPIMTPSNTGYYYLDQFLDLSRSCIIYAFGKECQNPYCVLSHGVTGGLVLLILHLITAASAEKS